MISFIVPGPPGGSSANYIFARWEIKNHAVAAVEQARRDGHTVPISGPILLGVYFHLLSREHRPPDLSNLIKRVEDALTDSGLWKDDGQVVGYLPGTGKYQTSKSGTEEIRTEIVVVEADPLSDDERTAWRSPTRVGPERR